MKPFIYGFTSLIVLCLMFNTASGCDSKSLGIRISKLVDQTTKSKRLERKAFKEIESFGRQATPYIIGHLGDIRPLAERSISFANKSPAAFEGMRQYTPATVHDALAAILNQVTGESFVFVYNGATLPQRKENRKKWIEWCLSEFPSQSKICAGEMNQHD